MKVIIIGVSPELKRFPHLHKEILSCLGGHSKLPRKGTLEGDFIRIESPRKGEKHFKFLKSDLEYRFNN